MNYVSLHYKETYKMTWWYRF